MRFIILTLALYLTPLFVSAQTGINELLIMILVIIWRIVPVLLGVALLVFIWGLIKYIKTNSDTERKEAVGIITYGIIGLFVIVSVWGIIALLQETLGIYPLVSPGILPVEIQIRGI